MSVEIAGILVGTAVKIAMVVLKNCWRIGWILWNEVSGMDELFGQILVEILKDILRDWVCPDLGMIFWKGDVRNARQRLCSCCGQTCRGICAVHLVASEVYFLIGKEGLNVSVMKFRLWCRRQEHGKSFGHALIPRSWPQHQGLISLSKFPHIFAKASLTAWYNDDRKGGEKNALFRGSWLEGDSFRQA